jgi:hypothetical protein
MADQQNGDGGFGFNSGQSTVDVTGAALQALAAAGKRGSTETREAVSYLRKEQNGDGGFGQSGDFGGGSNAQSTAWAVQGLAAAGAGSGGALGYLNQRQNGDGSIRYSSGSNQDPVWVTGQALLALERQPFPIGSVARSGSGGGGSGAGAGPGAGAAVADAGASAAEGGGVDDDDARKARAGKAGKSDAIGPGEKGSVVANLPPNVRGGTGRPAATAPTASGKGSLLASGIAAGSSALMVLAVRRGLRRRLAAADVSELSDSPPPEPLASTG